MKKPSFFSRSTVFAQSRPQRLAALVVLFSLAGGLGFALLRSSSAATFAASSEVETGSISGAADRYGDANASAGAYTKFGVAGSSTTPTFKTETLASGLVKPWDIKFLPTGQMLYNEKGGKVHLYQNGSSRTLYTFDDAKVPSDVSEGGLLGMAVDPDFQTNRWVYFCYTSTVGDERIARLTMDAGLTSLGSKTYILTGITASPITRHSGCRMDFGPDGYLYVGTGDGALDGTLAQDPKSLAGKVLRLNRDGTAAPNNQGGNFDARIYSYGHRNVQGIAFFPTPHNGLIGVTAEHGSDKQDELNPMVKGNFGWAPGSNPYNENVDMTDLSRFPAAIPAIWTDGSPTIEPSGITVITGNKWKSWNGAVAMAMEKGQHVRIMRLDSQNKVVGQDVIFQSTYGRIRTVAQGPDGNLYVSTDNGSNDLVLRLTPQ